ncbi:MAG TPA: AAA family ATPase, partial [Methanocorpusculum sp.]|nr:AAA family ATPase [Methanocorpusculum sp.]
MTALKWIEIDNFRGISHIRYEPKQVNLIIGRNNSGKSTLLDAIYDNVNGYINDSVKDEDLRYEIKAGQNFSVINSDLHELTLYGLNGDIPHSIIVKIDDKIDEIVSNLCTERNLSKDLSDEISIYLRSNIAKFIFVCDGEPNYFIINHHAFVVPHKSDIYNGLKKIIMNSLSNKKENNFQTKLNNIDNENKGNAVGDNSSNYIIEPKKYDEVISDKNLLIKSNRLAREFLWEFTDIFNPDKCHAKSEKILYLNNDDLSDDFKSIDNIRIIELEKILKEYSILPNVERLTDKGVVYRSESGEFYEIPYSMHGSGFIRLINFISEIKNAKDGILLIEEPENHMHPGYLSVFAEQLMTLSEKLNVQVFMTSH